MACFLLSMSIWAARDWSRSLIVKSAASTFVNGWKRPEDSSGATGTQQAASRGPPDGTRRLLLHATGVCPTHNQQCVLLFCAVLYSGRSQEAVTLPSLVGCRSQYTREIVYSSSRLSPKNFWLCNLSTPEWGLPGSWLPPRESSRLSAMPDEAP